MHWNTTVLLLIACLHRLEISVSAQNSKAFKVSEKSPAGTIIVGDLRQVLGLPDIPRNPESSLDMGNGKRESLLAISNAALPGASCFRIDELRGSLVVKTPPDRDKLCPTPPISYLDYATVGNRPHEFNSDPKKTFGIQRQDLFRPCAIQLSIVFGSPSDPSFEMLTIILEDINDHAPFFGETDSGKSSDEEHIIRIWETPRPTVSIDDVGQRRVSAEEHHKVRKIKIPLPEATDMDAPENGVRHYRLEDDDAYLFHLEIGPADGEIAVEVNPRPIVPHSTTEKRLWLVPTKVSGFTRTGNDVSGITSLVGGLDYEQRREYRFFLVAVDGGMPPRSGRLQIRLLIEDINDNAPIFNKPRYVGIMSEDDPPGHGILQFQASDADGKYENHRINFRIPGPENNSNESQAVSGQNIQHSEAQAAAAALFDIELINVFDIDLKQFDSSYNHNSLYRNSTTAKLIVQRKSEKQLRQVAKNALEVAKKLPLIKMDFLQVRSIPDGIGERELRFSEKPKWLRFNIEAYDYGKPPLSTQVPVFVEIIDVNDNAPSIFVDYLSLQKDVALKTNQTGNKCGSLLEGQGRSLVGQITVTDSDAAHMNNEVICSLNDSRFSLEPIPAFGMESGTSVGWPDIASQLTASSSKLPKWQASPGDHSAQTFTAPLMLMYKLMSKGPLDREMVSSSSSVVDVLISCTDNQNADAQSKQLTSHSNICFEIRDVNDNPPQFSSSLYTFRVIENMPGLSAGRSQHPYRFFPSRSASSGYFVGTVHATDKDAGPNADIEYSLSPNTNGVVEIDPINGSIFLVAPFDREKTEQFAFEVIATDKRPSNLDAKVDGKIIRLSSTAEVHILIDDVNDCSPEFEASNYNFEVEENVELAEVGRVSAIDADAGDFGRVRYRIAPDIPALTQEQLTLNTSTHQRNYIRQQSHLAIASQFQIDARLGIIRLRGRLDREKKTHYEFLILAVDNSPSNVDMSSNLHRNQQVSFTATATVLVMVTDQNDNAPQILSPRNLAEFLLSPEQMIAGTTIFTVQAIDLDLGDNATIEYELMETGIPLQFLPEDSALRSSNVTELEMAKETESTSTTSVSSFPFAIDRTAGICYLKQNLPSLTTGGTNAYTFRVKAYDLGNPVSLNSTATVRIIRGAQGKSGIASGDPFSMTNFGENGNRGGRFPANYIGANDIVRDGEDKDYAFSDKTMIIILTTVFALLLLLAVLLFIFFRYRRAMANRSLVNGVIGKPPDDKDTGGYVPGNKCQRPDPIAGHGPRKSTFPEVIPASWANSTTVSIPSSPMTFAYPTCMSPVPISSQFGSPQLCFRNPSVSMKSVTSPGRPRDGIIPPRNARHARVAQLPSAATLGPSGFVFRNYRAQDNCEEVGYQLVQQDSPRLAANMSVVGVGSDEYAKPGSQIGFKGIFMPINEGSNLSGKEDLPIEMQSDNNQNNMFGESSCFINLSEINSEKNLQEIQSQGGSADPLRHDTYQRSAAEVGKPPGIRYTVQLPSAAKFKSIGHCSNDAGTDLHENFYSGNGGTAINEKCSSTTQHNVPTYVISSPKPPYSTLRQAFITPPRSRAHPAFTGVPQKNQSLMRSSSIDSSFGTARPSGASASEISENSLQYNPIQISPFASPKHIRLTKRGASVQEGAREGENNVNFIAKSMTLGPEVRGSFV